MVTEIIRFAAKLMASAFFLIAGLFFGLIFGTLIIGPMFAFFSFISNESFSWKEHFGECWEMFSDPFVTMWGSHAQAR